MCLSHYSFEPKLVMRETESRVASFEPGRDWKEVFAPWIKALRALWQLNKPVASAAEMTE